MAELWNGYAYEKFEFEGKTAWIVFPEKGTEVGKLVFKTLYWGAFPDIELNMVKNG